MSTAVAGETGVGRRALRDLRAARRKRHAEDVDVMEVLYRVYLAAIFGGWGLGLVAGIIADSHLDANAVARVGRDGPALLGLALALALLVELRSGARGGPLAIQDADVQHVLLAPIERTRALRGPALRQLRTAAFVGLVAGLVVANFAFRRLPGSTAGWLGCLALFGVMVAVLILATAMIASGRRLRPLVASAIGVGMVAWSAADYLGGVTTSPLTMLGDVATLPLPDASHPAPALAGLAFAALAVYLGLRSLGGLSLEAARRRAELVAELRFSVTVRDIRTVILLRRQLAAERPRRSPWWSLGPRVLFRKPIWRRGCQSTLRWPPTRVARAAGVGVAAGLLAGAGWSSATPLLALVGPVLLIAGLDAVEPLAEEFDHPMRRDLLPVEPARLTKSHLVVPTSVMLAVSLIAVATAAVLGTPALALEVGAAMFLPTALLIVCCAALSATNDPYAYLLVPEMGYAQTWAPIVLAVVGSGLPLWAAREATRHGHSAIAAAGGAEVGVLIACAAAIWWLGLRAAKNVAVQPT